jgi:hypothetical protein
MAATNRPVVSDKTGSRLGMEPRPPEDEAKQDTESSKPHRNIEKKLANFDTVGQRPFL